VDRFAIAACFTPLQREFSPGARSWLVPPREAGAGGVPRMIYHSACIAPEFQNPDKQSPREMATETDDQPASAGRNGEPDFHKEMPSDTTHASKTDPDARLCRKSKGPEAKLFFIGHLLMENRHGLIARVDGIFDRRFIPAHAGNTLGGHMTSPNGGSSPHTPETQHHAVLALRI
jgi:hypothetical protein